MHDKRCEISAIPAATVVSFPRPLGITIVFSPRGIEIETSAQIYAVSFRLKKLAIPINKSGITTNLTNETI